MWVSAVAFGEKKATFRTDPLCRDETLQFTRAILLKLKRCRALSCRLTPRSRREPPSSCRLPPIVTPCAAVGVTWASLGVSTAALDATLASLATPTTPNRHTDRGTRLASAGKIHLPRRARHSEGGSRFAHSVSRHSGGRDRLALGLQALSPDPARGRLDPCCTRGRSDDSTQPGFRLT
jgi:hypothetical protein